MAIIGKNVIENLTTAMYENNYIIFREYIQNSADSIDKAIKSSLISPENTEIHIDINPKTAEVSIYDNGMGISKDIFKHKLTSVADSDKDRKEDKGFRGIGRLGGLACCDKLIFKSTVKGENTLSILEWDAKKLKEVLNDTNQRPTASELIDSITKYYEEQVEESTHFFEVILSGIVSEHEDILDVTKARNYLEAVAPVPYKNVIIQSKITDFLKENTLTIDEYSIFINKEQLHKGYTSYLYEGSEGQKKQYDEIKDIAFEKIFSESGELIAWLWYGLSGFKKQIPSLNRMRGIRLRKENIQIGDDQTLSKFFKETRGNYYFIGELFALHQDLIPNARRDYFNINETCRVFEKKITPILYDDLYKVYHFASDVIGIHKKQEVYQKKQEEYNQKSNIGFIDQEEQSLARENLDKAKKDFEDAQKKRITLEKKAQNNKNFTRIFDIHDKEYSEKLDNNITEQYKPSYTDEEVEAKPTYVTDSLSKLTSKERKFVSKIYGIINNVLTKDMADNLINKIQEELRK